MFNHTKLTMAALVAVLGGLMSPSMGWLTPTAAADTTLASSSTTPSST
jgi:hypothetical protein